MLFKSGNYIVNLLKQTIMFRTWKLSFGHPVWVHKVTDIDTSLDSVICTKKYNHSLEPVNKSKNCVQIIVGSLIIWRQLWRKGLKRNTSITANEAKYNFVKLHSSEHIWSCPYVFTGAPLLKNWQAQLKTVPSWVVKVDLNFLTYIKEWKNSACCLVF